MNRSPLDREQVCRINGNAETVMLKRHLTSLLCVALMLAANSQFAFAAAAMEESALARGGMSVGHKLSQPLRSTGGAGVAVAFLRSLARCDRRGNCKHERRMNPGESATARAAARHQVRN